MRGGWNGCPSIGTEHVKEELWQQIVGGSREPRATVPHQFPTAVAQSEVSAPDACEGCHAERDSVVVKDDEVGGLRKEILLRGYKPVMS